MSKKNHFLIFLSLSFLLITEIVFIINSTINYSEPKAIIVPHHNLVKEERNKFIKFIAAKINHTKTIIIVSPDHFSPYQNSITYADKDWELSNGKLFFDSTIRNLVDNIAIKNNSTVSNDHGIYNILADMKKYFPNSKILPILIGSNVSTKSIDLLANNLIKYCQNDCLYVASVDFSHYLPYRLAYIHDTYSLKNLENSDLQKITDLEVDSPLSLYIIAKIVNHNKNIKFNTFYYSNSGILENNPDAETTSYLMGWYDKSKRRPNSSKTYTFLISQDVVKNPNKKSIGERFFYGTDYTNTNLSEEMNFGKITIKPVEKEKSSIIESNNTIHIELGTDIAIGGIIKVKTTEITLFPLERIKDGVFFLRGEKKKETLKQLLVNIQPNKSITTDNENGTIKIVNNSQ